MKSPPNLIKRVLDAILTLLNQRLVPVSVDPEVPRTDKSLGYPPRRLLLPSWEYAVHAMTDGDFVGNLFKFNKDAVTDETCELLQPYLEMIDFSTEAAQKVSGSVAGLCTWVKAMVKYHEATKVVEPMRQKVYVMEQELFNATQQLRRAEAVVAEKDRSLQDVRRRYDDAIGNRQALQDDLENIKRRMERAGVRFCLSAGVGGGNSFSVCRH